MKGLSRRLATRLTLAGAAIYALLLLLVVLLPLGWLRGPLEDLIAEQVGAPAHIGSVAREYRASLDPVVILSDVWIAQPDWVPDGKLAEAAALRLRVRMLPLLVGQVKVDLLSARGVRLDLVRTVDKRVNWSRERPKGGSSGGGLSLMQADIDDATIRYRDAAQKRTAQLSLAIHPASGLVASGKGEIDGAPVAISLKGAPLVEGKPWAFDALIDGAALRMAIKGTMAGPLATQDMRFHMTARADDLKRIDRVIEAGLFGTQPLQLDADVRHAERIWTITNLKGRIGESPLTGRIAADKSGARVKLDGDVHFAALNFDDLASDAGLAKAQALQEAEGRKLVPNTRINIHKIDHTDGVIAFRADRILPGKHPTAMTNLSGKLTLEDRILTIDPLRIGLRQGAVNGRMIVDQRKGQPKPTVTIALDMVDSRISALAGGDDKSVDGRVDARVRLKGVGDTIREAVGHSDGSIGMVARSGALPAKDAAKLGFDIGGVLFGDDETSVALRCGVLDLAMVNGIGTVRPLLIDTAVSQTKGTGTVSFPSEALAITLTGSPKSKAALRLPGSVLLRGTIRTPDIHVPEDTKSIGNVLNAIGRKLFGGDDDIPPDVNCESLRRRAIGR